MTENNTVADGLAQYYENHTGPERGWLGPWEHVRGAETCQEDDISTGCSSGNVGRLKMGRKGWNEEALRFYDQYLKGIEPGTKDPAFAIQDNTGKWRGESSWPPSDTSVLTTNLKTGTYTDNGDSVATGAGNTSRTGIWSVSRPLEHDALLVGSGRASITVSTQAPRANLAIDVYDVTKDGKGPLITRQGALIRDAGESTIKLDLWSADWKLRKGRRIAVRITETNTDWWRLAVPTRQTVTVKKASVSLPFLRYKRSDTIEGAPGVQLQSYLSRTVQIPAATLKAAEIAGFGLPPALLDPPVPSVGGPGASPAAEAIRSVTRAVPRAKRALRRVSVKLRRRGRRALLVTGRAPARSTLRVRLMRGKRTVATRRVRVGRRGTFRLRFRAKKAGRYSVRVTGATKAFDLRGTSRALRIR
jgi:hypothetical protein